MRHSSLPLKNCLRLSKQTRPPLTTTIYHFGFSREDELIHAYAYRSTSDFSSEPLQYGLGFKPICHPQENLKLPDDIKTMMREQRKIQDQLPKEERLYIGGEIQIHYLSKTGFNVYTLDKFNDFSITEASIYEKFNK